MSKRKDVDPVKLCEWLSVELERQQKLLQSLIELSDELSNMSHRDPEYRSKFAAFNKARKELGKLQGQPS
jgi:hypothetical protein